MMKKFRIASDAGCTHYYHCALDLVDDAGATTRRRDFAAPKGSPANPMSDQEVCDKFQRLAGARLAARELEEYLRKFERLEQERDWEWLVTSFD